jgi:hypothetical protein
MMKPNHENSMADHNQVLPAWKRFYRNCDDWRCRQRNSIRWFIGGLMIYGAVLAGLTPALKIHLSLPLSPSCCGVIFASVLLPFMWGLLCFRKSLDDWIRRHRKRFWICMGGVAVYEAVLAAFARHFSHSPHPTYPDPRAVPVMVSVIAVTVLFFILWPLICFRFRKRQP